MESEIEAEQERDYRLHLATVNAYLEGCDEVLDTLDESRGLLREMDANYKFVEENSRALQAACEDMLDEQVSYNLPRCQFSANGVCAETFARSHRRYRISTGALQRARTGYQDTQSAWRYPGP